MSFPSHLWTADNFLGFALASNCSLPCLTECLWCILLAWAGKQAGPCIFRVTNLWYSAAHCHSPSLAVAHTCTYRRALLCLPLSRDSLTPRSSLLPHASALFFLGPGAAAEAACTCGLLCALGPGSSLTGGELAFSSSFPSDSLFGSLLSTYVEIPHQLKC